MNRKDKISVLLTEISNEVLQYVREHESPSNDRWVQDSQIKEDLGLNLEDVPKHNEKQYGKRGWFFGIIERLLENQELIEHRKGYCRTKE